jgi:S1-C subfamily serine protease
MTSRVAREMQMKITAGALVHSVVDDSPAEKAGIEENDVITEFNGKKIQDAEDLVAAVRGTRPDEEVPVVIARNDQTKSLKVKVGALPSRRHPMAITVPPVPPIRLRISRESGLFGLETLTLNSQLGDYFGAPHGRGVLVEKVGGSSPAAKAGFKAGDVILKLGNDDIEETEDLRSALDDYDNGDTARFQILRKGSTIALALIVTDERRGRHEFFRQEEFEAPEGYNHWFNNERFKEDMEELKEHLRGLGEEVKTRMRGVKEKIERELHQVGT